MSNAASNPIVPVLDQVIEFMEEALRVKQSDDHRIGELLTALQKEKADQERVILEKVAAARASFLDESVMKTALARLQGMGILSQENSVKLASRFKEEPSAVFPMMVKLAEKLLSAPGEGAGIEKESSSESSEEDPDGWSDFAAGRQVKVRR